MHLTIGVISKNGMPHLGTCLNSLSAIANQIADVAFILVDSASSDSTLDLMLAFSIKHARCRVYRLQGTVNAAAARNVILKNATLGAVFLVDGDVALNYEFVRMGLDELERNTCDVVVGRLPSILHDGQNKPYGTGPDSYHIVGRGQFNRGFGGVVLLGPQVVMSRRLQDETMRRAEDFDFSIKLAENYRILGLPVEMGTHYTIAYLHPARIHQWLGQVYNRPGARIIRDNLTHPLRIWRARNLFRVQLVGLVELLALAISVASSSISAIAAVCLLISVDASRYAVRGQFREWIFLRFVGMLQTVSGIVWPERQKLDYTILLIYPATEHSKDCSC